MSEKIKKEVDTHKEKAETMFNEDMKDHIKNSMVLGGEEDGKDFRE